MLHYETIEENTLGLLEALQKVPELKSLRLVGGTGLALQIGHRKSIDIDLFGKIEPDEFELQAILSNIGETVLISNSKNIKVFSVKGIKVDIVNYPFDWIEPILPIKHLRIASIIDIATMKLAAINGRGKKKDFIDLFFLLKTHNLAELLERYNNRFPQGSEFLVLKSLSYFNDAEKDEHPHMLIDTEWTHVKQTILEKLAEYIKTKGQ